MEDLLSLQELCDLVGLSRSRIGQFVKDGMPRHSHGKYRASVCIQWIISRFRDRKTDDSELILERMRLYREQRIKTELENEQTRRHLLAAEEVAECFNSLATILASRHDAVSGRLAAEVHALDDPGKIERHILEEMRAIRADVAGEWDAWGIENLPSPGAPSE